MAEVQSDDTPQEQAISWHLRLRDGGPADWEAFTDWLEADSSHSAAYRELAAADFEAAAVLPRSRPQAVPGREIAQRRPRRALWYGGSAVAASIGAAAAIFLFEVPPDRSYSVRTAAGEQRVIYLPDGSRIALNGSTEVALNEDRPRYAELRSGEALFTIKHDDRAPFQVAAGEARISDLGTIFNVSLSPKQLDVAVAEGAVLVHSVAARVPLNAGMALQSEGGIVVLSSVDQRTVGGWTSRRLTFSAAPLSQVAEELERNLGVAVVVDDKLAGRRFSGVIRTDGSPADVVQRVAAVLDVEARRSDNGWILR